MITSTTKKSGSRTYQSDNGREYPSVTTLIGEFEDKTELFKWRHNVGFKKANEISKNSASIGTRVHTLNEHLLKGETIDFSSVYLEVEERTRKEIILRHECFKPFLENISPLFIEEKFIWESYLYSRFTGETYVGFGGTPDIVGLIEDPSFLSNSEQFNLDSPTIFIADYKNWKSGKSASNLIKNYLQLAAYTAAVNATLPLDRKIRHGFVLGSTCSEVRQKTSLHIYYLDLKLLSFYWDKFYSMVKTYFGLEKGFNWWEFYFTAIGKEKTEETDPETGKAIYRKLDTNFLPQKITIEIKDSDSKDDLEE